MEAPSSRVRTSYEEIVNSLDTNIKSINSLSNLKSNKSNYEYNKTSHLFSVVVKKEIDYSPDTEKASEVIKAKLNAVTLFDGLTDIHENIAHSIAKIKVIRKSLSSVEISSLLNKFKELTAMKEWLFNSIVTLSNKIKENNMRMKVFKLVLAFQDNFNDIALKKIELEKEIDRLEKKEAEEALKKKGDLSPKKMQPVKHESFKSKLGSFTEEDEEDVKVEEAQEPKLNIAATKTSEVSSGPRKKKSKTKKGITIRTAEEINKKQPVRRTASQMQTEKLYVTLQKSPVGSWIYTEKMIYQKKSADKIEEVEEKLWDSVMKDIITGLQEQPVFSLGDYLATKQPHEAILAIKIK